MFEGINFIKSNAVNDGTEKNYAPMFRRRFTVGREFETATLSICGLGYAYSFINGKKTSEDLFTAPFGNYNKTLWYNEYDVTPLVKKGENVFAAICGNGWYNETLRSAWNFDAAEWRDTPKLILVLSIDGEIVLSSDENFKVSLSSPVIYNQLRSGEHFDARLYDKNWNSYDFDDSAWDNAIIDNTPPQGIFRACKCEPIRECAVYPTQKITKLGESRYVFDIGQNISGYVRLKVKQDSGDRLTIRYAEKAKTDGSLEEFNNIKVVFPESEFQTDVFICGDDELEWSPHFAYHGFRYIEIEGIKNPDKSMVSGVFVHEDIERRSYFECSNEDINRLFKIGLMSSYSNMFYMLTDCPTREKLGWTNDARASCDQMLTNFKIEKMLEKWMVDLRDAMRDDGAMPGIVPTAGWGYHWGNGPVSDGLLFEMAYRTYLHTGRADMLKDNLPYFERYLNYLESVEDENGDVKFGLPDWMAPKQKSRVSNVFINDVLRADFCNVAAISAKMNNSDAEIFEKKRERLVDKIKSRYINEKGRCSVEEQTAIAMLIYYDIYDELEPLKTQLVEIIERDGGHHTCGMVGIRHLLYALNKCGCEELAYKMLLSREYPSHGAWLESDVTALPEMWENEKSGNHHMFSDYMSWIVKTILGIAPNTVAYKQIDISPSLLGDMTYARGYVDTVSGKISVDVEKADEGTTVYISVPEGIVAECYGEKLSEGMNIIRLDDK